jgi:cytochrome b561
MASMSILNTEHQYGQVSRALHWIIVLAILAQWLLAEAGDSAIQLHQSVGMSVLALALVRLVWRVLNPSPAWPEDMKRYEVTLARVVHVAFYVLLFAIPITGWALSSVEDEPLRFFGWFDVPRLVLGSEDTLEEVHEVLFNILVALAALHALGAAKHWLARQNRGPTLR